MTGTSAVRLLLPYLPPEAARTLLRYVWQLDAAVFATHTAAGAKAPAIDSFATRTLRHRVDSGDGHAIKLTEVARERTPSCRSIADRGGTLGTRGGGGEARSTISRVTRANDARRRR